MTARDRRALLLGAIIAVTAFVVLRAGPWAWRRGRAAVERLHARTTLVTRMRADVRDAKRLEDSAAVVRRQLLALAPKLLPGRTTSEAMAALAGQLTALAERHRVRLDRTDAVPDSGSSGALGRVAVRTAIEGDTRGTAGFLKALTEEPMILMLREIRIVAPDPGSGATAPEVLRTELAVQGWYLPQGGRR